MAFAQLSHPRSIEIFGDKIELMVLGEAIEQIDQIQLMLNRKVGDLNYFSYPGGNFLQYRHRIACRQAPDEQSSLLQVGKRVPCFGFSQPDLAVFELVHRPRKHSLTSAGTAATVTTPSSLYKQGTSLHIHFEVFVLVAILPFRLAHTGIIGIFAD